MPTRTKRYAYVAGLAMAVVLAVPAGAANVVVVVPNTIVVVTVRSWCGGSRRHSYQLNGPHDPKAPDAYIRRTQHTRRCFFGHS
jgi:hypothetical protein